MVVSQEDKGDSTTGQAKEVVGMWIGKVNVAILQRLVEEREE